MQSDLKKDPSGQSILIEPHTSSSPTRHTIKFWLSCLCILLCTIITVICIVFSIFHQQSVWKAYNISLQSAEEVLQSKLEMVSSRHLREKETFDINVDPSTSVVPFVPTPTIFNEPLLDVFQTVHTVNQIWSRLRIRTYRTAGTDYDDVVEFSGHPHSTSCIVDAMQSYVNERVPTLGDFSYLYRYFKINTYAENVVEVFSKAPEVGTVVFTQYPTTTNDSIHAQILHTQFPSSTNQQQEEEEVTNDTRGDVFEEELTRTYVNIIKTFLEHVHTSTCSELRLIPPPSVPKSLEEEFEKVTMRAIFNALYQIIAIEKISFPFIKNNLELELYIAKNKPYAVREEHAEYVLYRKEALP